MDDRSRLQLINEWLTLLQDGLMQSNPAADEIAWWRLGMIEQACSRLSPAYHARHPEIAALGLPSLHKVLNGPPPPPAIAAELARLATEALRPMMDDLPPPPQQRPTRSNPNSRFDKAMSKLVDMEAHLRSEGIAELYIFGSVARAEDHAGSDIDLAFVLTSEAARAFSLLDQSRVSRAIAMTLDANVDLIEESDLRGDTRERYLRDRQTIFR